MSEVTQAPSLVQAQQAKQRTFRIRFIIEGLAYRVTPLAPDPTVALKAYRFAKLAPSGKPDASYDVSLSPEGSASCECLGFLRHQRCKHVRTLRAAGMFPRIPGRLPSE